MTLPPPTPHSSPESAVSGPGPDGSTRASMPLRVGKPPGKRSRPWTGGISAGRVWGIEVRLDYSWFVLFFVILGSLAGALFPAYAPEVSRLGHLGMGLLGAILFFFSLLLHELAHAVTARARGIEVEGITLFIFGGMAKTKREAETPGDEFVIAGMGPLASLLLAAGFYAIAGLGPSLGLGVFITVTSETIGYLNLLLAVFNLLPGFPLDGGRLLRAVLWRITGSLRRATSMAAGAGRILGGGVIFLGLWALLSAGAFVAGLWMIFIGWFLIQTAGSAMQHVLLQELLSPLTAREAMSANPETVDPDLPVDRLIAERFLRRPYNAFPVVQDDIVIGLVTLNTLRKLPREAWPTTRTADVMIPLSSILLVDPDLPMTQVLERMRDAESRRALVARDWVLLGIISTSDIARWLDRVALLDRKDAANPLHPAPTPSSERP